MTAASPTPPSTSATQGWPACCSCRNISVWIGYIAVDGRRCSHPQNRRGRRQALEARYRISPASFVSPSCPTLRARPSSSSLPIPPCPHLPKRSRCLPRPCTIGWHELYTTDLEGGYSFYNKLFGWTKLKTTWTWETMGVYRIFDQGDQKQMGDGGMMSKPPQVPVSCWTFYFNVDSIGAAIERVKANNGQIINGPMEVPWRQLDHPGRRPSGRVCFPREQQQQNPGYATCPDAKSASGHAPLPSVPPLTISLIAELPLHRWLRSFSRMCEAKSSERVGNIRERTGMVAKNCSIVRALPLLALVTSVALAHTGSPFPDATATIKVHSSIVAVSAVVRDKSGQPKSSSCRELLRPQAGRQAVANRLLLAVGPTSRSPPRPHGRHQRLPNAPTSATRSP